MHTFEARGGTVQLAPVPDVSNPDFGYQLWENVPDPAKPEGPLAIAMHVPPNSLSKVWELVDQSGDPYSETIELLAGSATLSVLRRDAQEWTHVPLTQKNPTGGGITIKFGDQFCVVTGEMEGAWLLSRPSKPFKLAYEEPVTQSPTDTLSRFIVRQVATL